MGWIEERRRNDEKSLVAIEEDILEKAPAVLAFLRRTKNEDLAEMILGEEFVQKTAPN